MSASVRSSAGDNRTSTSFATALTPRTRWAASSAAQRFTYESTEPVSVTTPPLTMTPISFGCSRGSHLSSARTSACICASVRTSVAVAVAIVCSPFQQVLCALFCFDGLGVDDLALRDVARLRVPGRLGFGRALLLGVRLGVGLVALFDLLAPPLVLDRIRLCFLDQPIDFLFCEPARRRDGDLLLLARR